MITKSVLILLFMSPTMVLAEQVYWKQGDPYPPLESGLPWPKVNEVIVNSSLAFARGEYSYSYTVYNSPKNWLPIYAFEVDVRKDPSTGALSRDSNVYQAERVPLSNIVSPDKWEIPERAKHKGPCKWFVDDPSGTFTILPQKSKSGYGYRSDYPSGVRDFRAEAYSYEFLELKINVPEEKRAFYAMSPDMEAEINKGISFVGKTIAPVAPPEFFTVSSWTLRMTEYAIEARKQKWIKTDKNLNEIKKLIFGLNTEDVAKVKIVVKKIEAYVLAEKKKGNLTDEADALVRLNAQYLLRRLESPTGKSYGETKP